MPFKSFQGHFHTLAAHFIPSASLKSEGERHIIPLSDGDRLVAYLHRGSSNVVVSLYHGLSGDVQADYMQRTAIQYLALGHSVLLVNHRGAGSGREYAKNPYHSGRAEDVSQVLSYLRKLFPEKTQIAAGFSMSGNILLYLLSGQKGECLPDAAIAVNAPINLKSCALALNRGFNRCYDLRFVRRLIVEKQLDISPWKTLEELDDLYTAPRSGFKDRHHYYETCSTKDHVHKIQTPTCVLTSADDPFIPVQDYREAAWSPAVNLKIHPWGGHLGYLSPIKNRVGNHRWLDEYMVESLQFLLQKTPSVE